MKTYRYIAVDKNNKKHKGTLEAPSRALVVDYLRSRHLRVKDLKEGFSLAKYNIDLSIDEKELIRFLKNLNILTESGLRVHEALEIIVHETRKRSLRNTYFRIYFKVLEGFSLSSAMKDENYENLLVKLIASGEKTKNLNMVLNASASYYENKRLIKEKLLAIFLGPSLYLLFIILIGIFIFVSVMPVYLDMYDSLEVNLPLSIKIFLSLSNFLQKEGIFIILSIFIFIISLVILAKTKFKKIIDNINMKIPLVNKLIKLYYEAFISKTLAILTNNKIETTLAIEIVSATLNNYYYKNILTKTKEAIISGEFVSEALMNYKHLDEIFVKMITVGERSGNLKMSFTMLDKYFDKFLLLELDNLKLKIKPILMLFIYLIASLLIIVVMLPSLSIMAEI